MVIHVGSRMDRGPFKRGSTLDARRMPLCEYPPDIDAEIVSDSGGQRPRSSDEGIVPVFDVSSFAKSPRQ